MICFKVEHLPHLSFFLVGAAGTNDLLTGQAIDQHGEIHHLRALVGAPVVVDFAATWCGPCYKALPRLEALAEQHKNVRFVVVNVGDTSEGRDRLVSDLDLHLPVLWDENQEIVERFAPVSFPATYVFDEQGRLVHQHMGTNKGAWNKLATVLEGLNNP